MDMNELYEQNVRTAYRYLHSVCRDGQLAEELTQETFLQDKLYADYWEKACA